MNILNSCVTVVKTRLKNNNSITLLSCCFFVDKGCYEIVKKRGQTTSSDINFELSTEFTTIEINTNSSRENMDTVKPFK